MNEKWVELAQRIKPHCYICKDITESWKNLQTYGEHRICDNCARLVDAQIEDMRNNKQATTDYWQHYSKE